MPQKILKLRLCLLQFEDSIDGPGVFAAGWDEDPSDARAQDDIRLKGVRKISGLRDKFITSIRYATVEVPVEETLELKETPNPVKTREGTMNPNIQADIEIIRSWAPQILAQGAKADPSDLKEIIRIRSRLDATIMADLESQGAPFFLLMEADKVCSQMSHTLLYLPTEDAEEAAAEAGGQLNSLVWYGIHNWAMTRQVLDHWTQVFNRDSNLTDLVDIHRAEVARAFQVFETLKGREYLNRAFFTDQGQWEKDLSWDDWERLASIIEDIRRETP